MKRIFSLLIASACILLCFCGCSMDYSFDNGKIVDNVQYYFNSKNKTCFAAEYLWDGKSTDIVIQDEVDGYKVTELGGYVGRGYPTPFGIQYKDNRDNDTNSDEGTINLLWESEVPETAVVHYVNFDIKIGKNVNCLQYTDGFSDYYKMDKNNYFKPLVTFSVSPENNDFSVDKMGKIFNVKKGSNNIHDFDYSATHKLESNDQSKFYKLIKNEDQTSFKYYIFDTEGESLDSGSSETAPSLWSLGDYKMQLSVQDGIGSSTNHAKYYDLKNSKKSKTFDYVLTAKDDHVVSADYRKGEHIIIVQDIFDKEKYYKEYKLENVSDVGADFAVDGYFDEEGNIIITYLSGENCKETKYTITPSQNIVIS